MSDLAIITGSDAGYFPLVQELIASVEHAAPSGICTFGMLDAGLTDDQRAWFAARNIQVVRPTPPTRRATEASAKRPALAVNLAKPWLDVLFPGHTTLVWLDADTWVQRWRAVELLAGAANTGAMAVVADSGRYWNKLLDVRWLAAGIGGFAQIRGFLAKSAWHARLSPALCRKLGDRASPNAGVFALRHDASHWQRMREWQERVLRHGKPFTSDQLAMALTIHADGYPVELLSTACNYSTQPRVDPVNVALLEYYYPYDPVGIVHLSAQKAMRIDPSAKARLLGTDGQVYHANLRYGLFHRAIREAAQRAPEALPA
ncbi:MAG TPA: glycosyl transferase [Acetobacteraceae bacterium]|nr:glycosyl transferase [Acetobacteraceae bacterium]